MTALVYIGRKGNDEIELGAGNEHRIRRSWLIKTDVRFFSEIQLLSLATSTGASGYVLPLPYLNTHPDSTQYMCKRLRARRDKNAPLHWIAEAEYNTAPIGQEEEDDLPPVDRRAKITWNTVKYQKAIEKDINNKGIVNSAGMPFNPPPLKDISRWTCTVTKNVDVVPTSVLTYADKLNSGTFTIGGISIAAKVAKIMSIQISDRQKEGDDEFYALSYTLEFDPDDKWKGKYLQQGLLQTSGSDRIPCVDKYGSPVRNAVPLDSSGVQIADPTTTNAAYTDYDIYSTMDFSVLPTS